MAKKALFKLHRNSVVIISVLLSIIIVLASALGFYGVLYGKVYPNVYVNNVNVSGLNRQDALDKIKSEISFPTDLNIRVIHNGQETKFVIPVSAIEAHANYEQTVTNAYNLGRSGSKRKDFATLLKSLNNPHQTKLSIDYNNEKLTEQVAIISSQVPNPPQDPQIVVQNGIVTLQEGTKGNFIDPKKVKDDIVFSLQNASSSIIVFPQETDPTLTPEEKTSLLSKAEILVNKSLILKAEDKEFTYEGQELVNFLTPEAVYRFTKIAPSFSDISTEVGRSPQNPVFKYEDNKVQEFSPAIDGLEVDISALETKTVEALDELLSSDIDSVEVAIPLKRTPPDFATSDVNDLGIKELIGVGTSSYHGSISSRVYNVAHAASKLNGILIKPGETFSFVNTLGDISALTGYKQAYVIQGNQTVLGDGGGVCQVSTTFFRAALNAGLPIVERHPHSYRVSYYEQSSPPGIDATIYHPTVDIKIKNDTPGHILIQTFADSKNMTLRFEFYGTSDGRVATIGKPIVTSSTPPPEDLYIDDPTLPAGEVKQIDYKAWGAKVNFTYKVERDGEVIFEDTYFSNYRPWQAKFLRGTGPAV